MKSYLVKCTHVLCNIQGIIQTNSIVGFGTLLDCDLMNKQSELMFSRKSYSLTFYFVSGSSSNFQDKSLYSYFCYKIK